MWGKLEGCYAEERAGVVRQMPDSKISGLMEEKAAHLFYTDVLLLVCLGEEAVHQ